MTPRLRDGVALALRRARGSGRPVLAAFAERLRDRPDPLELLAAAEQRGTRRFFAARARPGADLELLGLGSAACVERDGRGAIERTRAELDAWLASAVLEGTPEWPRRMPLALGGAAFEARSRAARDPLWRDFASAGFAVPELLFARFAGAGWLVRALAVEPHETLERALARGRERWGALLDKPGPERQRSARVSEPAPAPAGAYRRALASALTSIRRGEPEKVVLAHAETRTLPGPLCAAEPLRALLDAQPDGLVFAQGVGGATLVGASPERLIRLDGTRVECWAVAGTTRCATPPLERERLARTLRESPKERAEHDFVVQAIHSTLAELCTETAAPDPPEVLDAGLVQHLRTRIRARLARPLHVLDLVARLHPTPALGGTPRQRALELIRALESFDRGWYAGPIGWIDGDGGGDFWVALRCGLLAGRTLRMYAGSGLVAASDPEREAEETALKLRVLWRALESA